MDFFQTLAARITFALTIGLVGVLIVSAWLIDKNISNDVQNIVRHEKEHVMHLQAYNASLPMWNLDKKQLKFIINNIIEDEAVVYARITDIIDGKTLVSVSGIVPEDMYDFYVVVKDITYNNHGTEEVLGHLTVALDLSSIDRAVEEITHRMGIIVGGMLAALMAVVYIIIRHMVEPVSTLSNKLLEASADNNPVQIDNLSTDTIEIKQLFDALKSFQRKYRLYHEELISSKEAAEAANIAKSEFLANMSHELRTPLNSIIGITRILRDDAPLDSEEREMASTAYKSGNSLLQIVNDILDLSKIEAGQLQLESLGVDFKELVYDSIETLAHVASRKGLSLNCEFKVSSMPYIKCDPVKLSRILMNLGGNAIKYTSNGHVDIIIDCVKLPGDKVEIECSVSDTGIGIPQDRLDAIFLKFTQVDETTTRRFGGTGLGLTITKELVEMMGGRIGVTSRESVGSIFWFRIPFEISEGIDTSLSIAQKSKKNEDVSSIQKHVGDAVILVAEDHSLNQIFIKKLLDRMGFRFDVVDNGIQAVDAIKAKDYDLVLMDCHMPERNGYQATGDIRKMKVSSKKNVPIIALTADAMVGSREKCINSGMDDYISKPIDSDEFEHLLSRWFIFPDSELENKKNETQKDCIINLSNLNEHADTQDELADICSQFCYAIEKQLAKLKQQCIGGRNQEWVSITHKMKGSTDIVGANRMRRLLEKAQKLENSGKEDREQAFEKLSEAFDDVKAALKKNIPSYVDSRSSQET